MKSLFILSICILCLGCCNTEKKVVTISGLCKDSRVEIAKLKTNDSIYIDTLDKGKFVFEVNDLKNNFLELRLGKRIPLFAETNDSLVIEVNEVGEIHFSGKGFEESKYLEKKRILMKDLGIDDPRKIDIALYSSDSKIFLNKIDSLKQIRINHLDDFRRMNTKVSETFWDIEYQLINYFWLNQQFGYPEFYEMLTKNKPELPADYYKFIDKIETNNIELSAFNIYKSVLRSFLNYKAKDFKDKYTVAKKIFTVNEIFNDIVFREINSYINYNGIDGIDAEYKEFINRLKDGKRKEYLMSKYNSWSGLAKGIKAPDFELKDKKGNTVRLSDFKGKLVYIDCWSSSCGPCIKELPALKKLSEDLKDDNIVFVSISSDKDKKRWLSTVKRFDLHTTNLCAEGARHKFFKDYNIKALPRYILVDSNGVIIDVTADCPSKVKELLKQLL